LFDELDRKREMIHEKHPDYTQETAFDIANRIISEDDDRKRFTKEAKNPQKALDDKREQQQRDEMEDDRSEAKQEARQNGESWSEIADEWEDEWIQSNWDDELFQHVFKKDWKQNHHQEFPNSDYAPKAQAT
jgi:hypothetical protein